METERPLNILLIEDSETDALLLRALLEERTGKRDELIHVTRLEDGLSLLGQRKADLVLLDLALPDSIGIETFERLHSTEPGVPVVVMTSLDDLTTGIKALQAGAQDYLIKRDIQADSLHRAIYYAIERNRLHVELNDSRNHLRRLAAHIEALREAERTRISREIHDELGQKLTSVKMDVQWINGRLSNQDRGETAGKLRGSPIVSRMYNSCSTACSNRSSGLRWSCVRRASITSGSGRPFATSRAASVGARGSNSISAFRIRWRRRMRMYRRPAFGFFRNY